MMFKTIQKKREAFSFGLQVANVVMNKQTYIYLNLHSVISVSLNRRIRGGTWGIMIGTTCRGG